MTKKNNIDATSKHLKIKTNKKKLVDSRCGDTCNSIVFMTIVGISYSIRKEQKGNTTQGHWCNINLCS
jgi:hypothetical protein